MKRVEEKKGSRKVRSDKKRDVKPVVHIELYECIVRLAYITNQPIKDIGEKICREGMQSKKVIDLISQYFRRNFFFSDHITYQGMKERVPCKIDRGTGERARITLRIPQCLHDRVGELAYALDLTIASTTALLLESSVKNTDIIHTCIEEYVEKNLDEQRKKQLKEVLHFINQNNPYEEKVTISMLLKQLAGEFMDRSKNIKQVLNEWIENIVEE